MRVLTGGHRGVDGVGLLAADAPPIVNVASCVHGDGLEAQTFDPEIVVEVLSIRVELLVEGVALDEKIPMQRSFLPKGLQASLRDERKLLIMIIASGARGVGRPRTSHRMMIEGMHRQFCSLYSIVRGCHGCGTAVTWRVPIVSVSAAGELRKPGLFSCYACLSPFAFLRCESFV